jgi:hypothetical protein
MDMGNCMKYNNICGQDFKNKSKAYKFFRSLVKDTVNNSWPGKEIELTENTILKHSQVQSLFDRYLIDLEWYKRKTNGNKNINYVLIKDDYDDYCLGFKFENGSTESVTAKKYLTCFGKGTETDEERLHSAMRYEVKYQSEEYRNNGIMRDECEWCAAPKEAIRLEVDHAIPYKELVNNFFKIHDKEEFTKGVNKNEKGLYWRLSQEHRKLWCEYHGKNCMFQMLCITCHKNKTNEER